MRKSFINYVCDEGSFRKKKDRFSNFSPILFFQLSSLSLYSKRLR